MKNRTYVEVSLCLFSFIAFYLAMMATGLQAIVLCLLTFLLVIWIPFGRQKENRLTRAVSLGLAIAAIIRAIFVFLPNPTI